MPFKPSWRQNGDGKTAKALMAQPMGVRWVNWSRIVGMGGS